MGRCTRCGHVIDDTPHRCRPTQDVPSQVVENYPPGPKTSVEMNADQIRVLLQRLTPKNPPDPLEEEVKEILRAGLQCLTDRKGS